MNRNVGLALGAGLLVVVVGGAYVYRNRATLLQGALEYTLPPLPYEFNALEPYIDTETMKIHYTKHHQTYIDKLNAALADHPDVRKKPLEYLLTHLAQVPEAIRTAVKDNGGGHYNHSFFWLCMAPVGTKQSHVFPPWSEGYLTAIANREVVKNISSGNQPIGTVKDLIDKTFGSLDAFKEQFNKAAEKVFGSGWVWLVLDKQGKLKIVTTANQDTPITQGLTPLLGLDVWEHAYYLKYQNRKAEYSTAWWHVVNWEQVERNYTTAQGSLEKKAVSTGDTKE